MNRDRNEICKIISDMLDSPDENGIYHTSTAYNRFEHYTAQIRAEAIGWTHSFNCVSLDNGEDPRLTEIPEMLEQANRDLDFE